MVDLVDCYQIYYIWWHICPLLRYLLSANRMLGRHTLSWDHLRNRLGLVYKAYLTCRDGLDWLWTDHLNLLWVLSKVCLLELLLRWWIHLRLYGHELWDLHLVKLLLNHGGILIVRELCYHLLVVDGREVRLLHLSVSHIPCAHRQSMI